MRLSASKTDPTAISVTRCWGCICGGNASFPCPYHAGLCHFDALLEQFGNGGILPLTLPFFPNRTGGVVSKASVVQAFEGIASDLGISTVSPEGSKVFGGHTARVTGAQQLSAPPFCMELLLLQLLARWAGPTILRYAQEAPLLSITDVVGNSVQRHLPTRNPVTTASSLEELRAALAALQSRVDVVSSAGAAHLQQLTELRGIMQSWSGRGECIINGQSQRYHRPLVFDRHVAPASWKSWCGWAFGFSSFTVSQASPRCRSLLCRTCFPGPGPSEESAGSSGSECSSSEES